MPTVTGTEVAPGGTPHAGAQVRIRLVASTTGEAAGYDPTGNVSIDGVTAIVTDASGVWTAVLTANALITPANTVYVADVVPTVGRPIRHTFSVPNTAGPFRVEDILAPAPAALSNAADAAALAAHAAAETAARTTAAAAHDVSATAHTGTLERLSTINVKTYGALGDGAANDTAAINTAIAALPAGGGTLLFPAGTYMVTPSAITALPTGTRVVGMGLSATTIKWRANTATTNQVWYTFIAATSATDIQVTGITFHGNRSNGNHSTAAGAENFDALWFSSDNKRIWVHHNRFTNFRGDSMYVTRLSGQPSDITFEFNTVDDVGKKEAGDGGDTRQGFVIISGDAIRIIGNRFTDIGSYAVDLEPDTSAQTLHNIVVADNVFDTVVDGAVNLAPFAVADATDITIANNTVYGSTAQAFLVKGTGVSVTGNVATNCVTRGCLVVAGSTRVSICGNSFRVTGSGSGVSAVYLDIATYCTVVGNVLMGTLGAAGVKEAGASNNNYFASNAIDHATRYEVVGAATSTDIALKTTFKASNIGSSGGNFISDGVLSLFADASNPQIVFYGSGVEQARFDSNGHLVTVGTRQVRCGALGVGNSAAATTLGTVTKKIEVFSQSGVSLGFLPVYGTIT